jgi:aldose 1-epimerase
MNRMISPPRDFGATPDGSQAVVYTLSNGLGLEADICNFGALLTALRVPDAHGRQADVVLGYDRAAEYKHSFGATIGRFAGPIAKGACTIDGASIQLGLNGGSYHIHGGSRGFNKRLWEAEPFEDGDGPGVRLSRISPDGEEGYPGALKVSLTYRVTRRQELRLDYEAVTDRTTLCNLTNHSYFNLGGHDSGPVVEHRLKLECDSYNINDADIIATNEVAPVRGTPFDFSAFKAVGADIDSDCEQLRLCQGYDHNYLLPGTEGAGLRKAATVMDPKSGRKMEMWTTEPGFQFYAGNSIPEGEHGKQGALYGKRHGLCLEAQRAPNWPHRPGVTGALLKPGDVYRQTTLYRFIHS